MARAKDSFQWFFDYTKYMQTLIFWGALAVVLFSYMTLWYGLARYTHRFDVVDSAWGLGFVLVAWVSLVIAHNFSTIAVISALLVSIWGIRLFTHIANRNWRKSEDDHRYQAMSQKWGSRAGLKFYTNVFLLQGVLLLVISTPVVAIARFGTHITTWVVLGWVIWLGGILFEALADYQLATFIKNREKGSHSIMQTGLWKFSRHPNYFGEVTTWWGAAVVACAVGAWWGVLGAAVITLLITKVSGIPPLEKHYTGNKDYEAYAKRTSVFVPLPVKHS